MDLSIVLPVHVAVGVLVLRRRRAGYLLAPIVLAFDVPMASSIAGMMLAMHLQRTAVSMPVVLAMTFLATSSGVALVRLLRGLTFSVAS